MTEEKSRTYEWIRSAFIYHFAVGVTLWIITITLVILLSARTAKVREWWAIDTRNMRSDIEAMNLKVQQLESQLKGYQDEQKERPTD